MAEITNDQYESLRRLASLWRGGSEKEAEYSDAIFNALEAVDINERLRTAANAVLWSWDTEHDPSIVDHMEALRELLPPIAPPDGFETE